MDTTEEKLVRLRKLYVFARSQGNLRWMERIKTDAERLKENKTDEPDLFDEAKRIFGTADSAGEDL